MSRAAQMTYRVWAGRVAIQLWKGGVGAGKIGVEGPVEFGASTANRISARPAFPFLLLLLRAQGLDDRFQAFRFTDSHGVGRLYAGVFGVSGSSTVEKRSLTSHASQNRSLRTWFDETAK